MPTSSPPRLWSWNLSPFAGKARIAMAIKQVEVELIEIDPLNRHPRLAELNPARTVPVLELGDRAVLQSWAICEWAEEVGPGPSLWPGDALDRARARGLMRWVDDELTTNFFLSTRKASFGLDERFDHPNLVTNLQSTFVKRLKPLERMLGQTPGPWLLGGDEPVMCDLAALPLAVRLPTWGADLQPDPDIQPAAAAWLAALREHPAAVEVDRSGTPLAD